MANGMRRLRELLSIGAVLLFAAAVTGPAGAASVPPKTGKARPVFPLGVWDQTPELNAQNYANIGITQFVGLSDGLLRASLAALAAAHLHLVTDGQSPAVLAGPDAGVISAWLADPDEPDDAQERPGGGYGPCVDPAAIIAEYKRLKAADPTRPVELGLGRGVADVNWGGRGSCTGDTAQYPQYARGADILSFDVYPVNEGLPLDIVATGVDNLLKWDGGKPTWADIETTDIDGTAGPTPAQTRAETWLAIIHGATGITYFCHIFTPSFDEAGCLHNPAMAAQLAKQNALIQSLASVILTAPDVKGAKVSSAVRVDQMTRKGHHGSYYVFAVDPEPHPADATFTIPGARNGTVTVIGTSRTLHMTRGVFTDHFRGYGTHLYRLRPSSRLTL